MADAFLNELWMQWHLAQEAQRQAPDGIDRAVAESRLDNLRELALRNDIDLEALQGLMSQPVAAPAH